MEEPKTEIGTTPVEAPSMPDALGSSTDPGPAVSTEGTSPEEAPKEQAPEEPAAPVEKEAVKKDEPFVWDGGVENLPKELQSRGEGMLKHMHKVTQEAAQVKRDADTYQELVNHPEFKEFLKWQDSNKNSLPPAGQASPGITEEELLAAQTDPQHFDTLVNKRIDAAIQPLAKQAMSEINNLKYQLELGKQERTLESFGQTHDGFTDMMQDKTRSSIMQAIIQDVVVKNKGTLEDAWTQYQSVDKDYLAKAQANITKQVKAKKGAVTASPSKPGEPEVVYVDSSSEANKLAFEYARRNKRVDVRVRKKK